MLQRAGASNILTPNILFSADARGNPALGALAPPTIVSSLLDASDSLT